MISLSYRLSPDFNWRERGNIVQQVKRGKSYSAVARFWSRKKRKAISWTTIRAICNRAGVKTSYISGSHKPFPLYDSKPVKIDQNKWGKKEIAFILIFIVAMILLGLAELYGWI